MVSTFFGLETARRALQSNQTALDVTGHNISNANTAGYTRQTANLKATTPLTIPGMGRQLQVGTGVNVDTITRTRDIFIDQQFRNNSSRQQYWTSKQEAIEQIEAVLNEPTDNSLRADLDRFWNAWSELSKDPESMAARTVVRESALNLINGFNHIDQQVGDLQRNLDTSVRMDIQKINGYAVEIAELNKQISHMEATGGIPNDLYDRRDVLIDDLSKLVNVKVVQKTLPNVPGTQLEIIIGDSTALPAQKLVDGGVSRLLKEYSIPTSVGETFATLSWMDDNSPIKLGEAGFIQAAIEVRGDQNGNAGYLADFTKEIDDLANGVANAVNALHIEGQDLKGVQGGKFFDGDVAGVFKASNIKLNSNIETDATKIAAATIPVGPPDVNTGDGSIALAISSLSEGWTALSNIGVTPTISSASLSAFYSASVAKVGSDVQYATRMQEMQSAVTAQLGNQREAVSGVSLDEEMINLVKFQKSYSAAARVVTIMDTMLETIINGMGVTR